MERRPLPPWLPDGAVAVVLSRRIYSADYADGFAAGLRLQSRTPGVRIAVGYQGLPDGDDGLPAPLAICGADEATVRRVHQTILQLLKNPGVIAVETEADDE
jgi:hypothetical protein